MRTAPQATSATPDDIDLRDVFRTIGKKLPKLLISSLLVGAATAGVLMNMLPRYTSVAQFEVFSARVADSTRPADERDNPSAVQTRLDPAAVGTHVLAMQSNEIALKLIEEFRLAENPEFNSALPPVDKFSSVLRMAGIGAPKETETDRDRTLTALRSKLRISNPRETRQISAQMSASDPALAARIANRVGSLYRDRLASATITETNDAADRLRPQVERLIRDVAAAEQEVLSFRSKLDLFKGNQPQGGLTEQQLSELTAEQVKAETAKAEAQGRATTARQMMASGSAEALPDVQKNQLIPRLVEQRVRQERQISELSATLLPGHPRMKQLQADLAGLNRQIKTELQKIVDGLEKDARLAADKEAAVRQRLVSVKRVSTEKGPDEARLRSLEDTVKIKRDELARVQKQYEAAESTVKAGAVPIELRAISQALPSSEKAFPKVSLIAPLASAATFILGLFLVGIGALFRGARSGGAPAQAEAAPQTYAQPHPARALAVPRALDAETIPVREPVAAQRQTEAAGTVGAVAQALLTRAQSQMGCRTMVSGASPSFDAVPEAVQLAKSLAASGRSVALIEWSDNGGGLSAHLGIEPRQGTAELINGSATFDDVVQSVDETDLHIVTAGTAERASADIDAERANLILDSLDESYEHIIVIAPENEAKGLFAAIQGRFDIGVTVEDGKARGALAARPEGSFLGYSVEGLETFTIQRRAAATSGGTRGTGATRRSLRTNDSTAAHP